MFFHIDMNSYFASVEQQFDAKLRGKPLGVCAYLSRNGCIIASSIEAKKWGVKTGMRVVEAKRLCPILKLVENDPKKYRATTEKIFAILKEYSDDFEPYSIDEAFLQIPYVHTEEEGRELGREWNTRIKKEVGEVLRSSVGFAENKFYAKLFSDTGPKDSVTHVPYPQLDNYLGSLVLEDIWGIGRRIAARMRTLKLFNPLNLKNSPPEPIIEEFGVYGYELWKNLNCRHPELDSGSKNEKQKEKDLKSFNVSFGFLDSGSIHSPDGELIGMTKGDDYPKSIGHSYCLPVKTYNLEFYKKILYKLCERTCIRLREMRKVAYGISYAFPQNHFHRHSKPNLESRNKQLRRPSGIGAPTEASEQKQKGSQPFNVSFGFLDSEHNAWNDDSSQGNVIKIKSHSSFKTAHPISDALDMYHLILPSLENLPQTPLYMIAVSLFSLSANERKQLNLFEPSKRQNSKGSLLESFDSINRKWGAFTVIRGAMFEAQDYAHDRIGFRKL